MNVHRNTMYVHNCLGAWRSKDFIMFLFSYIHRITMHLKESIISGGIEHGFEN